MGLWTLTHLYQLAATLAVFAVVSVVLAKVLGRKPERIRYIPLQVIAVTLLALEVGKQICSFRDGSYDLYALPFHYCSLFLYLLPFHAFYHGKHSHLTDAAAFGCLASLVLDMLLMPDVIYSAGNIKNYFGSFMDFHTVTFHNLVILYFMLTVALRLCELRTRHDLGVMSGFLAVYVTVAAILSYTLKVNFHNLYQCNIPFVESFRLAVIEKIGVLGTVLYVVVLFILTILFAYAAYFLAKGVIAGLGKLTDKGNKDESALSCEEAGV